LGAAAIRSKKIRRTGKPKPHAHISRKYPLHSYCVSCYCLEAFIKKTCIPLGKDSASKELAEKVSARLRLAAGIPLEAA